MKKTFPLQEVIDDLVNTDKSLTSALMKLNYFGRLIKNDELIHYTNNELNGYRGKEEEIPEYRKTIATLFIEMQAYQTHHSGQLPISMLDEPYRSSLQFVSVREGISAVEKLARETDKGASEGQIATSLPMEMLHILHEPARKLYKTNVRLDVISARLSGNSNIVVEIPNAIRTKLLEFVMLIAEKFDYDIEIESFNKQLETNNQTIIHQMSNTINNTGDGNIINTGDKNQIENNVTLYKGDTNRLQDELRKQGIEEEDIAEITEIVQNEQTNAETGRLGEKANGWISKIINKSLNGIGKIATGISVNLLATLVKGYYGIN
nr:hypothetical protein [uncultured Flavobacterium sp.]